MPSEFRKDEDVDGILKTIEDRFWYVAVASISLFLGISVVILVTNKAPMGC